MYCLMCLQSTLQKEHLPQLYTLEWEKTLEEKLKELPQAGTARYTFPVEASARTEMFSNLTASGSLREMFGDDEDPGDTGRIETDAINSKRLLMQVCRVYAVDRVSSHIMT